MFVIARCSTTCVSRDRTGTATQTSVRPLVALIAPLRYRSWYVGVTVAVQRIGEFSRHHAQNGPVTLNFSRALRRGGRKRSAIREVCLVLLAT